MLPDDTSWLFCSPSSSESQGDTNRAVGRGPVVDGPLDFFRIGGGLGFDEDDGAFPESARLCFLGDFSLRSSSSWLSSFDRLEDYEGKSAVTKILLEESRHTSGSFPLFRG